MLTAIIAFSAFISSLIGGLTALKYRDHLHHILGFTAGVLLGAFAFEIVPELFHLVEETGIDPIQPMIALVIGFLGFHIIEKLTIIHHAHESEYGSHDHPQIGVMSALALAGHSLLDGIAIGLAFKISPEIGAAIAITVIAHHFTDGLNTVSLMLAHNNSKKRTFLLLLANALAPVLGVLSTLFFEVPADFLLLYLGFFAGFILYIGASDILPEAHSRHASRLTIVLTILGVVVMFGISQIGGHAH